MRQAKQTSFRMMGSIVGVLVLATTVWAGKYNAVISIGDSMPTFKDLPTATGKTLSSTDLKASIVVLVSLANHCPWVQGGDADLVKAATTLQKGDVGVVAFNVSKREADRLPAMKTHAKDNGYNFPYVFDESQELGRALGATKTPEFFVFNKDRKLVYTGLLHDSPARKSGADVKYTNGDPKVHYVIDAVKATMAGNAADPSETRAHGCSVKYE